MILGLPELIQGIIHTLDQEVAPQVATKAARAQLYACLDLLNNLEAKIDWKSAFLAPQLEGIEAALARARPLLDSVAGQAPRLATVVAAIARFLDKQADETEDLFAGCLRANQVLEDTLLAVHDPVAEHPAQVEVVLEKVRAVLDDHLRNETVRAAFFVKPMMLERISRG